MTPLALISFAGASWWVFALPLAALLGALAWYALQPAQPNRAALAVGLGLRGLGIALLLLALLDPQWIVSRAKRGANIVAVIADNSRGLDITEIGADTTRAAVLREALLAPDTPWLDDLSREFQLRSYAFDRDLRRIASFEQLDHRGNRSDLGTALRQLRDRLADQPLAGVVLLTDGNATDLDATLPNLDGLPPIYPVVIGAPNSVRDLRISRADLRQTAFDDAPVAVRTAITGTGLDGAATTLRIAPLDQSLASALPPARSLDLPTDPTAVADTTFEWRPSGSGVQFYTVSAQLTDADSTNAEATPLNNRRHLMIDRGRPAYRILYVGGRPNWEFKFLNRALADDPQLDLVALLRLARREPKFEFRGGAGESNNPLFRGFDGETDAAPRYDEPVLTRLNTRDEEELRAGFPRTAEELFAYDAIILDDVEAAFFNTSQQMLLRRFAAERGGGLLFLGGADTLENGGYADSPLAAALPIYLDRRADRAPRGELRWDLTREGWVEPWVRILPNAEDERNRLADMPAFLIANGLTDTKPGATVLASLTDDEGRTFPGLAAQRFGAGRVAAVTVGDLWRWGLQDAGSQADLARFWRQLSRWLVTDVPSQVELQLAPAEDAPEAMRLRVTVRDEAYRPLDLARVNLTIEHVVGSGEPTQNAFTTVTLTAEPEIDAPGRYTATFTARDPGAYRVSAEVTDRTGKLLGRDDGGWVHDPLSAEFASLEPNLALLEALAFKTGGQVLQLADREGLANLSATLTRAPAPITESRSLPLWHNGVIFILMLGCWTAEWIWRRWKGLP
ncbi:glutamine amidotransferase [Actomonas aquatica]|uniref:Glutamine amidotransferase n=1 Tax=Actomonas aquatica TaxID=2866162 RepID=A0ABZ1C8S8_9BACT|nr:glutamine amidotransferase [Opitutus sp. WL0086]WRQ87994.1 glutamine amidotransferase [Opitutus sp. WL0086]